MHFLCVSMLRDLECVIDGNNALSYPNNHSFVVFKKTSISLCRFLFGVLTYLAVGSAIRYFVRGERGVRVLPNYDFWRNFVLLTLVSTNSHTIILIRQLALLLCSCKQCMYTYFGLTLLLDSN